MIQVFIRELTHIVLLVGVLALLLLLRRGLRLVQLKPAYRRRLDRALPVLEIMTAAAYMLWAVSLFVPAEGKITWWVTGVMASGFLAAGWFAIRDLVSGVVLRSENAFTPGQWIQTDRIEGFITRLGYRTLEIETDRGLQIKLPYSQLAKTMLATADRTKSTHAHTFTLEISDDRTVAELTSIIRTAALTAFWSSPQRDPYIHYIELNDGRHQFEVTVFSMHEAYVTDLERSIRRQVADGYARSAD